MNIKEIVNTSEGDLWIMSDLHYNHQNVLKFDKRPFSNVQDMNEYIKKTLVEKIKPCDTVIDLGDMFWKCDLSVIKSVLESINPKRFYKIIGNHDKESVYLRDPVVSRFFDFVGDLLDIGVKHKGKDYRLVCAHYPIISWEAKPRGAFMLHGHTHGNVDKFNDNSPDLRVDVGFYAQLAREVGSFIINFTDILNFMTKKAGTTDFRKYVLSKCPEL